MSVKFKVCGLMREEDVSMCVREGVDMLGFVVDYPLPVPWNIGAERCSELLQGVRTPARSCVVSGGEREKLLELAMRLRPDYLQLHYHETLDDTAFIVRELKPYGVRIIKTLPLAAEERMAQFDVARTEDCVRLLNAAGVDMILVDARGPANAAAGGVAVDLDFYASVKAASACPVMLGGGITPANCAAVIAQVKPDVIDVMTGVESAYGVKSARLVRELLAAGKTKTEE